MEEGTVKSLFNHYGASDNQIEPLPPNLAVIWNILECGRDLHNDYKESGQKPSLLI